MEKKNSPIVNACNTCDASRIFGSGNLLERNSVKKIL